MIFDKSIKYYPLKYQILPHHYNGKQYLCSRKKIQLRCETLIIIFYLYKKIKHWKSIGVLIFQCFFISPCLTPILSGWSYLYLFSINQYKSVVCFIAYLLPKSICDI